MTSERQQLVKYLIDKFVSDGKEILYANCQGYLEPKNIDKYKPDIIAWDPNQELYFIGETFTKVDLSNSQTRKKLDEFSNMMMSKGRSEGKRLPLYIGAQKEILGEVNGYLKNTGVASRENIHTKAL